MKKQRSPLDFSSPKSGNRSILFKDYDRNNFFCELTSPREGDDSALDMIAARLAGMPINELHARSIDACLSG